MTSKRKQPAESRLHYRIEANADRSRFALIVTRDEGPRLFDFSTVHFSTATNRAELRRRVKRLYPEATETQTRRRIRGQD